MHSGARWTLGHRPALDGLRGVAIALVLLRHGETPAFRAAGAVGVTLFFVLSGFLITSLLLEERNERGWIDLRAFYVRRVRRLAPAFFFCVAITCAMGVAAAGSGFLTVRDVLLSMSYVGNWYVALAEAPLGGLTGTWSLAVEEQFYLLWPIALIVAARSGGVRRVAQVAAAGVLLSLVGRFALYAAGASEFRIYYGTDTNALSLLSGALLACALSQSRRSSKAPGWILPGALLGLWITASGHFGPWVYQLLPVVAFAAIAVWACAAGPVRSSWLAPRWMVWLGSRSYGIYLWNCVLASLLVTMHMSWPVRLVAIAVPALLLAELSWRCVEQPFMRSRRPVAAEDHESGSSRPAGLPTRPTSPSRW